MDNFSSSPTLNDCTISRNVGNLGGGMWNRTGSHPTITNCDFIENSATGNSATGGGMHITLNSSPKIMGCRFSGNTARLNGGAMQIESITTVTACTFSENSSLQGSGGAIDIFESSPKISHCTFSGNSAAHEGGGMYSFNGGSPKVTHCTFSGNSAESGGRDRQ